MRADATAAGSDEVVRADVSDVAFCAAVLALLSAAYDDAGDIARVYAVLSSLVDDDEMLRSRSRPSYGHQ